MTDGGTWQPPEPAGSSNPGGGALPPPSPEPPAGGPAATPPTEPIPVAPVEPAGSASGRSRGKVIAAAVGAVAIIGAGVFAITRVAGDSSSGGASSPEAAADAFLDALDDDDVLGLVEVLLPGERDTFREPLEQLVDELQRLEVLSSDADLAGLDGIDISITERDVVAEPTNVDDIVNLEITATATATVTGEELPIGDWIRDALGEDDLSEIESFDETSDEAEGTFPVTAVRKDGRWYLSAFYTLAESLRHEAGDPDIPAEGVALNGGESPEAAVDNLVEAAAALDIDGAIGSLNPNEFEALQRYAPLITGDAQDELDAVDASIEVTNTAYEVTGSGPTRHVSVSAFAVEAEAEGERATFEYTDGCFVVTAESGGETQSMNSCEDLEDFTEMTSTGIDAEQLEELQDLFRDVFDDYENPGITVDEVDGRWYVSPMGTYFDQLFALSGALSRDEIEELVDRLGSFVETVEENGTFDVVPIPGMPDYSRPGDVFDDEVVPSTVPDEPGSDGSDESFPDDTTSDDTTPDDTDTTSVEGIADRCYAETTAEDASACFGELVERGDISLDEVPWWLQHPECGISERYWSGEYTTLPDDEFVALVEEAAPCYEALVEDGEMSEFSLPPEIAHPECLEGRNPWQASSEELDEFFDCVYG